MAYTGEKPADNQTIAAGPADIRDEMQGLATGQVVDAGTLQGLAPGNTSGAIPISNGNVNANLNADKLQGKTPADFAPAGWVPPVATSSSTGSMSGTDKAKLDTVATNAEVNQNAFSNVKVGSTTLQADSKTDTLEVVGGANITVTPDAVNDRLTIAVSGAIPIANGGTGATTAATTLTNLGITATAAELNHLDGIAATVSELNYCDGVTSNIQTQLNAKAATGQTFYLGTTQLAINRGSGALTLAGVSVGGSSTSCTGNSATATKLATARTITITGDASGSTSFDGSGNASISIDVGNANTVGGYTAAQLIANAGGIIASSLGTNGYVKFGNGLILQWGNTSFTIPTQPAFTTFPIAFNTVFSCIANSSRHQAGDGHVYGIKYGTLSTNGVQFQIDTLSNTGNGNPANFYWLAIGN